MAKTFKVRVEGHREAPEGHVEVTFTNRKPPEKPKKGKDGPCAPCGFYDPWKESVDLRLPMTKEQAEDYPVGKVCALALTNSAPDDDDSPKRLVPKGLPGKMVKAGAASRAARKRHREENESDEDEGY